MRLAGCDAGERGAGRCREVAVCGVEDEVGGGDLLEAGYVFVEVG